MLALLHNVAYIIYRELPKTIHNLRDIESLKVAVLRWGDRRHSYPDCRPAIPLKGLIGLWRVVTLAGLSGDGAVWSVVPTWNRAMHVTVLKTSPQEGRIKSKYLSLLINSCMCEYLYRHRESPTSFLTWIHNLPLAQVHSGALPRTSCKVELHPPPPTIRINIHILGLTSVSIPQHSLLHHPARIDQYQIFPIPRSPPLHSGRFSSASLLSSSLTPSQPYNLLSDSPTGMRKDGIITNVLTVW